MIVELPAAFRAACHWALFVRSVVGDSGLPPTDAPPGLNVKARAAYAKRAAAVSEIRGALFPDG